MNDIYDMCVCVCVFVYVDIQVAFGFVCAGVCVCVCHCMATPWLTESESVRSGVSANHMFSCFMVRPLSSLQYRFQCLWARGPILQPEPMTPCTVNLEAEG